MSARAGELHQCYVKRRLSVTDDAPFHAAGCYDCNWLSVGLTYNQAVDQALAHERVRRISP